MLYGVILTHLLTRFYFLCLSMSGNTYSGSVTGTENGQKTGPEGGQYLQWTHILNKELISKML